MKNKSFYIVVYDIPSDKRRTRLHKCLKDYGSPVQYSVFECLLDPDAYTKMKTAVKKIVRPRLDHVRYYQLCADCRSKIHIIGQHKVTSEPGVLIV